MASFLAGSTGFSEEVSVFVTASSFVSPVVSSSATTVSSSGVFLDAASTFFVEGSVFVTASSFVFPVVSSSAITVSSSCRG